MIEDNFDLASLKIVDIKIPQSFEEMNNSIYKNHWLYAAVEEYVSLIQLNVFELVSRPLDRLVLGTKTCYQLKQDSLGFLDRFKVRFVAKGYDQIEGIDFDSTHSPTLIYENLKILLIIALNLNLSIFSIDIKTAYLYADLDKNFFIDLRIRFRI